MRKSVHLVGYSHIYMCHDAQFRECKMFQYISNKMQRYTVLLYLETALHVSGGTSTHHQECI